jgi:hypothetical protein
MAKDKAFVPSTGIYNIDKAYKAIGRPNLKKRI